MGNYLLFYAVYSVILYLLSNTTVYCHANCLINCICDVNEIKTHAEDLLIISVASCSNCIRINVADIVHAASVVFKRYKGSLCWLIMVVNILNAD